MPQHTKAVGPQVVGEQEDDVGLGGWHRRIGGVRCGQRRQEQDGEGERFELDHVSVFLCADICRQLADLRLGFGLVHLQPHGGHLNGRELFDAFVADGLAAASSCHWPPGSWPLSV